jgi:hypothetical protein
VRRVFITRCWAAAGGPLECLGGDDLVRKATIEESGVFWEPARSARRLYHSTDQAELSQCRQCSAVERSEQ